MLEETFAVSVNCQKTDTSVLGQTEFSIEAKMVLTEAIAVWAHYEKTRVLGKGWNARESGRQQEKRKTQLEMDVLDQRSHGPVLDLQDLGANGSKQ